MKINNHILGNNRKKLADLGKLFSYLLLAATITNCLTFEHGTIGYLEPSPVEFEPDPKALIAEECFDGQRKPFMELVVKKAPPDKLKNVVMMHDGVKCYQIFAGNNSNDRGSDK